MSNCQDLTELLRQLGWSDELIDAVTEFGIVESRFDTVGLHGAHQRTALVSGGVLPLEGAHLLSGESIPIRR